MAIYPWQAEQWARVVKQVNTNKVPHAFLLNGVEGIGKQAFAEGLVAHLLCEQVASGLMTESCGSCKQCRLLASDTHPDYKNIAPEGGSSILKVDTIRALVDFFAQSSMQGGRKLSVLAPAEALNHNAANALLKTLEEPSGDSVIILVSHSAGQLLPTIRSRCQVIDFSLPEPSLANKWLSEELSTRGQSLEAGDFEAVMSLASNAPLKALKFIEAGSLDENRLMLTEMASFLRRDVLSSELAGRWGDDIAIMRLEWMIQWVELVLKVKMTQLAIDSHPAEKMINHLAKISKEQQLLMLYNNSLAQLRLLLGTSNPNKQLLFEYILSQWAQLMAKQ